MNDDGGPSYWWRDTMVERIYKSYLTARIDQEAVDRLKVQIDKLDDDGIFRFEAFIQNQRLGQVTNVDDLVDSFIESEKKAKRRHQTICWVRGLFASVLLPTSLGSIYFSSSFKLIHWVIFSATLLFGLCGLSSWLWSRGEDPVFVTSTR